MNSSHQNKSLYGFSLFAFHFVMLYKCCHIKEDVLYILLFLFVSVFALVACVELSGPPYSDGVFNLRVGSFVNKMSTKIAV